MRESLTQSIKSLPPLSSTIMEINRVYEDKDSSVADMIKVVQNDPMIVANLLKVANSPLYSLGREITNIAQAVGLFGMGMTRSIALGNAIRKLLNVDMLPYGITSDRFAHISNLQAMLIKQWYGSISKQKAEQLYLGAFLQEVGKILIASEIIKDDETTQFASEIETSNFVAVVENNFVGATSAAISALVFEHWKFKSDFIDMIRYSDTPQKAPEAIREFSNALHIVKRIVPVNKPFAEISINVGLKLAQDSGYDTHVLKEAIESIKTQLEN